MGRGKRRDAVGTRFGLTEAGPWERNKVPARPISADPRLVNEAGHLAGRGEALYRQTAEANPDPKRLIPVLVAGDWLTPVGDEYGTERDVLPAYLRRDPDDGSVHLWNGFLNPLFTREVAERLVAWQQDALGCEGDLYMESLEWDGDDILVGVEGQYRDETPEDERTWRHKPSEFGRTKLWAIGDGWTWGDAGHTLERDPFHRWLQERIARGEQKECPVGNASLYRRFLAGESA